MSTSRSTKLAAVSALLPMCLAIGAGAANAGTAARPNHARDAHHGAVFSARQIVLGTALSHSFLLSGPSVPTREPLSHPDDIAQLGRGILIGFQNGVGAKGEASSSGNLDSTIVEIDRDGHEIAQWDVAGKVDGLGADAATGVVIATVNEDANSSLFTIDPSASTSAEQLTHFQFNIPLVHDGGSDAVTVEHDQILVSASAPGTTGAPAPQPTYPAMYAVTLHASAHLAAVVPVFNDEDTAVVANLDSPQLGSSTALALTDPHSNAVVPFGARFGGDVMLTSQGDLLQLYISDAGSAHQHLSVLNLTQSVDDTVWPENNDEVLYATDSANDTVDAITGPFEAGQPIVVATPCGSNSAPSTCPDPGLGFPPNYLATLNQATGEVTQADVGGATFIPQGGLLLASSPEAHNHLQSGQ